MTQDQKKTFTHIGQNSSHQKIPGKSYSLIVRFLRLALPMVAIGIIGLLLSWNRVEDTVTSFPNDISIPQNVGQNELVNPKFESADEKNQPFSITALRAVQSARDPSVVLLEKPMADITLKSGTWLAAQAQKGAYRQNTERLLLQGEVKLFHDDGYEVTTDKLLVNLQNREAWSDEPVYGQGPAGSLEASGMQAHSNSNQLIFTGPAKLTLNRVVKGLSE